MKTMVRVCIFVFVGVMILAGCETAPTTQDKQAQLIVKGEDVNQLSKKTEAVFAKSVKVSVVCLRYNPPEMYNCCDVERNLTTVCARLDQAAEDGADLVLLPMECVNTPGESIPGPISNAIAEKALEHKMYIIGNIRESDGGKTYVTSFLCDRSGNIIGKYRKSHKMPDETMDLGDELPVFQTDFGKIAMRIGSDRFFVDIDHVYTAKGAAMICWSQMPEPFEDEYQQDMPSIGRAGDYNVFIACARYSTGRRDVYKPNWVNIQGFYGMSLGKSYIVNREGMFIACTPRMGSSVATAVIPSDQLSYGGRGVASRPVFPAIWDPVKPLNKPSYKKRTIVATAIPDRLTPDQVLTRIDEAGAFGSDIVCPHEVEWCKSLNDHEDFLNSLAQKAAQYQMYILMSGVLRNPNINEGLLYDRNGQLVFTYTKICPSSRLPGNETPVYDTDFGRIAVRICCDEQWPEIDRSFFIKGAELLCFPTMSWEPDGIYRNNRDFARALDTQMFQIQSTHLQTEFVHRSFVVEPTGIPIVQNRYSRRGDIVSAVIDLDNDRPKRFVRQYTQRGPGGYMPRYKPDFVPGMQNDLADVIRQQRRPELYISLWPAGYNPPRLASNPTPANGAKDIVTNPSLSWTEGWFASSHNVYFGTSFDDVDQANDPNTPPGRGNQTSTTYNPGTLLIGRTYFWRIDEICPVPTLGTWKGEVWSFTVNDSSSSASSVVLPTRLAANML